MTGLKAGGLLALVLTAGFLGWHASRAFISPVEPQTRVVTDTVRVTPEALALEIQALRMANRGLVARVEGRTVLEPQVVTVTDTVRACSDLPAVVAEAARVRDGILTWALNERQDSMWASRLESGMDISSCDEGWSFADGELVCDPARLGHVSLIAGAALTGFTAGVEWSPSYRSSTTVFGDVMLYGDPDMPRYNIGVRTGVRIW